MKRIVFILFAVLFFSGCSGSIPTVPDGINSNVEVAGNYIDCVSLITLYTGESKINSSKDSQNAKMRL